MSIEGLLVGAGTGHRTNACACASAGSPFSFPPLLTSPPSRRHTHRTLRNESSKRGSCAGGRNRRLCSGGGWWVCSPVAADNRMYGIARPYASSPPARHILTGAAQPLGRRERVGHLLRSVGSRQRLVSCVSGGTRASFARHPCPTRCPSMATLPREMGAHTAAGGLSRPHRHVTAPVVPARAVIASAPGLPQVSPWRIRPPTRGWGAWPVRRPTPADGGAGRREVASWAYSAARAAGPAGGGPQSAFGRRWARDAP
jgi:hypothetical protein